MIPKDKDGPYWPTPGAGDDRSPSIGWEAASERHAGAGVNKQMMLRDYAPRWPEVLAGPVATNEEGIVADEGVAVSDEQGERDNQGERVTITGVVARLGVPDEMGVTIAPEALADMLARGLPEGKFEWDHNDPRDLLATTRVPLAALPAGTRLYADFASGDLEVALPPPKPMRQQNASGTAPEDAGRWRTPPYVVQEARDLYLGGADFTLDAAADETNHVVPRWLGPDSDLATDALAVPWNFRDDGEPEQVWLNFPYNKPYPWVEKAWGEALAGRAETVMIVAATLEVQWFWNWVYDHEANTSWPIERGIMALRPNVHITPLKPRVRFHEAATNLPKPGGSPPWGSMFVRFWVARDDDGRPLDRTPRPAVAG